MSMKDKQLAKEIAERRMSMIAPLVGALSSPEEYYEKRREISAAYEVCRACKGRHSCGQETEAYRD